MFKSDQTSQRQLFAFSVRELVPETSDVWLYVDLFDELDRSAFERDYSTQGESRIMSALSWPASIGDAWQALRERRFTLAAKSSSNPSSGT